MTRKLKIAIVGGGIGGAALATSLHQRGMDAHVYERASSFGEIGAGVQMTPNAVKILRALGVYDKLRSVAFQPEAAVGRNWRSGKKTFWLPFDKEFQTLYNAPYLQIHRADLLQLFTSQLPPDAVSFGHGVARCEQTTSGAVLTFSDGSQVEADVVVGADGVRSTIRSQLHGETSPRWTGHTCYRALVPVDGPVRHVGPYNSVWMGPNSHVVTYYVKGGRAINIVAVIEAKTWHEEGWSVPATPDELSSSFPGWHSDLQTLFSQVTETFRWGLFDRDPMERWTAGHVTLLGDAAHPMLPFLSQGAAMAIEDGYVLAAALDGSAANIPLALSRYEAERRPRTSRVQLESRHRGETYHLPSAFAQFKRDVEYRIRSVVAPKTGGMKADWIYEYDGAEAVRPFLSKVA